MKKKTPKRPATSGSFRKGCRPGPGRLPKLKSNEDKHFLPIDVPIYDEPPQESEAVSNADELDEAAMALATFAARLRYKNRKAELDTFGYWTKTVYVPKEKVRRFIEIYKKGRLKDAQFTKLEAWKILVKETCDPE